MSSSVIGPVARVLEADHGYLLQGQGCVNRYARNMRGHGPQPPPAGWPGAARLAVQFVVNYEEGGERCLLHGDNSSEAFLSEIIGAKPWPDQRHHNMESMYEYGARAGFWRLHRIFSEASIPVTIFGVATALARSPEQVAAMQDSDWEIASHGLKWIDYRDHDRKAEAQDMAQAIKLHHIVTGERPQGWYTGRCSSSTLELAAAAGFEYLSDAYDDDLPHWQRLAGRDQLIVPYTLDANDMRFATHQGFNSGDQFLAYLRDTFDTLYEEGGRMMSIGLHCRLAGRPGRARALQRFIDHARAHANVWFARRIDIARHWQRTHPPRAVPLQPSVMNRTDFIAAFGGIFEHSPWVAERAWELELGAAHDCAAGVHSALVRAFRAASAEERLGVLKVHPDLAGKLAQARHLTAASNAEQSSAGLDALTGDEQRTFSALNTAYMAKHGFPFIIAARDHDKAGILAAFTRRLEHDTADELGEACRQVERIAWHRVQGMWA